MGRWGRNRIYIRDPVLFVVPGIEPRALCGLGNHSTAGLHL